MSSVPKSQYDDLQRRHENLRKRTATVQRKIAKMFSADQLREAQVKVLREAASKLVSIHDRGVGIGIIRDMCTELEKQT